MYSSPPLLLLSLFLLSLSLSLSLLPPLSPQSCNFCSGNGNGCTDITMTYGSPSTSIGTSFIITLYPGQSSTFTVNLNPPSNCVSGGVYVCAISGTFDVATVSPLITVSPQSITFSPTDYNSNGGNTGLPGCNSFTGTPYCQQINVTADPNPTPTSPPQIDSQMLITTTTQCNKIKSFNLNPSVYNIRVLGLVFIMASIGGTTNNSGKDTMVSTNTGSPPPTLTYSQCQNFLIYAFSGLSISTQDQNDMFSITYTFPSPFPSTFTSDSSSTYPFKTKLGSFTVDITFTGMTVTTLFQASADVHFKTSDTDVGVVTIPIAFYCTPKPYSSSISSTAISSSAYSSSVFSSSKFSSSVFSSSSAFSSSAFSSSFVSSSVFSSSAYSSSQFSSSFVSSSPFSSSFYSSSGVSSSPFSSSLFSSSQYSSSLISSSPFSSSIASSSVLSSSSAFSSSSSSTASPKFSSSVYSSSLFSSSPIASSSVYSSSHYSSSLYSSSLFSSSALYSSSAAYSSSSSTAAGGGGVIISSYSESSSSSSSIDYSSSGGNPGGQGQGGGGGSSSSLLIYAAAGGGAAALILIVILCVCYRRHEDKRTTANAMAESVIPAAVSSTPMVPTRRKTMNQRESTDTEEAEITRNFTHNPSFAMANSGDANSVLWEAEGRKSVPASPRTSFGGGGAMGSPKRKGTALAPSVDVAENGEEEIEGGGGIGGGRGGELNLPVWNLNPKDDDDDGKEDIPLPAIHLNIGSPEHSIKYSKKSNPGSPIASPKFFQDQSAAAAAVPSLDDDDDLPPPPMGYTGPISPKKSFNYNYNNDDGPGLAPAPPQCDDDDIPDAPQMPGEDAYQSQY